MSPVSPAKLMFDWAQDHRRRLALWIILALLLHAGAYFLFRIVTPPAVAAPKLDQAIFVLEPGSAEARRLAPIIAANDPSLAAADRIGPIAIDDPPIPTYKPSYSSAPPAIATLPDRQRRLLPPIVRDYGPVPVPDERSTLSLPKPASATMIQFGGGLLHRRLTAPAAADYSAPAGGHLLPATFLLKVSPEGRVLHVFESEGTGSRELDATTAAALSRLRFEPADSANWGTATIHWGDDVKRTPSP